MEDPHPKSLLVREKKSGTKANRQGKITKGKGPTNIPSSRRREKSTKKRITGPLNTRTELKTLQRRSTLAPEDERDNQGDQRKRGKDQTQSRPFKRDESGHSIGRKTKGRQTFKRGGKKK